MADDHAAIRKDFDEAVNMTPAALRKHLDSDAAKEVGQKKGGADESTGHEMGRRILAIRDKKADLDDDDYAAMKKVVGYVHRHMKQGGKSREEKDSPWRLSLMNWGHDPLKG